MKYEIVSDYRKNDALRASFNRLAEKTFGLSFEGWYQSGFWNDRYIPCSILSDGEIIANVSVNIINCTVKGRARRYVQLGTIMTDESFRGQGLSRVLMEKVISDHSGCDGIFLYANDSVVDFYPRFGFTKAEEYRYRAAVDNNAPASVEQVSMKCKADHDEFIRIKKSLVSRSPVVMDTDDLLMFYLTQFMQETVFKLPGRDCYIIAEAEDDELTVYDILSKEEIDPREVCSCFGSDIRKISFAFIPDKTEGLEKYLYTEEDTTFFVLGDTLKNDLPDILSFPALVHA